MKLYDIATIYYKRHIFGYMYLQRTTFNCLVQVINKENNNKTHCWRQNLGNSAHPISKGSCVCLICTLLRILAPDIRAQ